ncbi:thioredoxin family protein [Nanchangia anserum]|uniref:thioredoxin family protein n=1 Tax=Nanchangia anserum TaxID=2692125 RepID=UPI001D11960F|nr:thioredoxin domain-containing protein [Nanchangia anserum]
MADTSEPTVSPAQTYGAVDLSATPAIPPAAAGADDVAGGIDAPLVVDVTDATFEDTMNLSMQVPIVLDLWAEWCQPCKQLGPILEEAVRELGGRIQLAKVDIDANPGLAQTFQVQSVPTVMACLAGDRFLCSRGHSRVRQLTRY